MGPISAKTWLSLLSRPEGPPPSSPRPPRDRVSDLCDLADRHGVLPAILRNLGSPAPYSWTERLAWLTGLANWIRHWLHEISVAFTGRRIPHMVLKGPEFADRLYPDPALRLFTDLELLVPKDALPDAAGALAELGYQPQPVPRRKRSADRGEQTWIHPDRPPGKIEVHWNLTNSPALRQVLSVQLSDLPVEPSAPESSRLTAAPEALLLIAVVHGAASYQFSRFQILCDIRQSLLSAAGPIHQPLLSELVDRTGAALALAAGVELVRGFFPETPAPAAALSASTLRELLVLRLLSPEIVLSGRPLDRLRRRIFRHMLKVP